MTKKRVAQKRDTRFFFNELLVMYSISTGLISPPQNIKCIDNQYITFIKVQIICKCMHKTTYTKYKGTLFIMTSFYFLCTKSQYIVIMLAFSILRIYFLIFDDDY